MECRNDLHLTSTGVGHQLRCTEYFPLKPLERSVEKPLPLLLSVNSDARNLYKTTTGSCYNYKHATASLSNDVYRKSPGHWKVSYTADMIKKLKEKPQRHALTMANQTTEARAQFACKSSSHNDVFAKDDDTFLSRKVAIPSNQHVKFPDNSNFLQDRGVFNFHDGFYLSTTRKDYRHFQKSELAAYPRKEYATYWECECYPKAWGHGSNDNPLPKDSVLREKGPMRDATWFKSATSIPRLPRSLHPIPHKGMCSEVRANFKSPTETHGSFNFTTIGERPLQREGPGPEEIFSVPKMYKTEYQFHGSGRTVMV